MAASPDVLIVSLCWDWFHSLINFKGNTGVTLQRAASPHSVVTVLDALASPGPPWGPTDHRRSPRLRWVPQPFLQPSGPSALSLPGLQSQALPATTRSGQWVEATLASQAAIGPGAVWLGSHPHPTVGPGPARPPRGLHRGSVPSWPLRRTPCCTFPALPQPMPSSLPQASSF